jgi:hypothetical protein
VLVLVALLFGVAALGLVACGGSASTGGGSGDGSSADQGGSAVADDSFMKAYPTAQEAMVAVAQDAVPLGAGTGGLALADVPDSWSFTFFSPGQMHAYIVDVQHGTAGEPRDFGEAAKGTKIVESIDPATIKVGAAQAVAEARELAGQSGSVPKNVMVGGTFALTPTSEEAGFKTGVWTVTFATGTDLADARTFTVDMMTGAVAKAPKE